MLNANQELVELYDQGLNLEQICSETGYELAAVKSVLLQSSSKYRRDARIEPESESEELLITKDEDREIVNALKKIGLEDESAPAFVKTRALIYLHDEFKGRNDKEKGSNGINVSILMLNNALREARKQIKNANEIIIDECK